jgi:membrane associated rhomboid family serine protease
MFQSSKTVKQLFYANFIVFIIGTLLQSVGFPLYETFALNPPSTPNFEIYQFITYMFLHSGILHIVFNMLALVSLGYIVEDYMGRNKFILFYLLTGIGSALLHLLLVDSQSPMVGASGAIYGIMVASALISPNEKVSIFPIPIGIKLKYLISVLFGIEILLGIFSTGDGVGHFAHVGGGLTGILFYLINRKVLPKKKRWS